MAELINTYASNIVSECLPKFKHVCKICCNQNMIDLVSVFSYIKFRPHKMERNQLFQIADLIMMISDVKVRFFNTL